MGLIIAVKIPVQELGGQRGEWAYFLKAAYFRENTATLFSSFINTPSGACNIF